MAVIRTPGGKIITAGGHALTPGPTLATANAAAPAAAPTTIVSFAGPAGAPTGPQVPAAFGGGAYAATLDGTGGLVLPNSNYAYATLPNAPPLPATGVTTFSFETGVSGPCLIGRTDASGANGGYVVFFTNPGHVAAVSRTNGAETIVWDNPFSTYAGYSNFGLRVASDGSWHVTGNGADLGFPAFTPPAVANGFAAIGTSNSGSVTLSGITYQSLADADAAYAAAHPPSMTVTGVG